MQKQIKYTKETIEEIHISPYTEIFVNDNKLLLIRKDLCQQSLIECSKDSIISKLKDIICNENDIDINNDDYYSVLDDETINKWIKSCLEKGLIE